MEFISKYGEHIVLANLLANDIEAYLALKYNQDSYDITAIVPSGRVVRIQVKAISLKNASTNNTVGKLNRTYDFLVIVVVDKPLETRLYVLTLVEALELKGKSKQLAVSRSKKGVYSVRQELIPHEGSWAKVRDASQETPQQ